MVNRSWPECELGNLVHITTGKLDSNEAVSGGGYPFFTCSPRTLEIDRHAFDCEAVLLAGNNANGVFSVKYYCGKFNAYQRTYVIVSEDSARLKGKFLFYALQLSTRALAGYSIGTATKFLTMPMLRRLTVPVPPVEQQEEIVEIVDALDDKIELNRYMNQTLEAMARAIFKSWFVDFDPVREGRAWSSERGKVEDLALFSRESMTPEDYPDEVFDHHSIPAFDEGKVAKAETGGSIKSNKFLVVDGAILLSKLNPRIPRVWLPSVMKNRRSISSTEFLVVLPRRTVDREYLYSFFCSPEFLDRFASRTTGTSGSHQRVRPDDLMNMEVTIPEAAAREHYSRTVMPMFTRVAQSIEESRTLTALRDALLPKLLSGEIRIKQAEKIVGEVV